MSEQRQRSLEDVKRIVLDRLRGHPVRVYLFGSSVTGARRRASDIDVAIEPLAPLPPSLLPDVREALEESTIPYDVDVVDLSAAAPEFRERVKRQGIAWTARASAPGTPSTRSTPSRNSPTRRIGRSLNATPPSCGSPAPSRPCGKPPSSS